jgi:hypothetical protein
MGDRGTVAVPRYQHALAQLLNMPVESLWKQPEPKPPTG